MTFLSDSPPFSWQLTGDEATAEPLSTRSDPLIARCLAGETQAYAALHQKYAAYVYRLCYSVLQQREDAEEVMQDAFEYAFRRLDQFDPQKSAFKTWLYRIAISRCRNKRRRKWLPTFSLNNLLGDEENNLEIKDENVTTPEAMAELTGQKQLVWEAIGQLSDKLRETAVLRYYEGFSYQEIGQVLNIPEKTAESRMRLAHKSLKRLLKDKI